MKKEHLEYDIELFGTRREVDHVVLHNKACKNENFSLVM